MLNKKSKDKVTSIEYSGYPISYEMPIIKVTIILAICTFLVVLTVNFNKKNLQEVLNKYEVAYVNGIETNTNNIDLSHSIVSYEEDNGILYINTK